MANVWFCVLVVISLQQVFARDCSNVDNIKNCDECMRCGGTWCLVNESIRCSISPDDTWCTRDQEQKPRREIPTVEGDMLHPQHIERYVYVGDADDVAISYQSLLGKPKVTISLLNSSFQGATLEYLNGPSLSSPCDQDGCKTTISAIPTTDFCPAAGSNHAITINVRVDGISEVGTVKYTVPCACACSDSIVKYSENCNKRGDYSCGSCSCHAGWKGDSCEEAAHDPVNPDDCDRGDISGCVHPHTNLKCSNNGLCLCGECKCFNDKEGSQYFDEYCTDICTTSSYCDACLKNQTLGRCEDCPIFFLDIENCNSTLLEEKDANNKTVWIQCTEKSDDEDIHYAAMRDKSGVTHIMILDSCPGYVAPYMPMQVTVPAILGVLAMVAVATAVAGVMVWRNRTPALPTTDPEYQNIDAEDRTGENPLYKPPTSSFKNPMYGKC